MRDSPVRKTVRRGVADTGTQLNIVHVNMKWQIEVDKKSLPEYHGGKEGIGITRIHIAGAIYLHVIAPEPQHTRAAFPQKLYFIVNMRNTYLSYYCLHALGVIGLEFPTTGQHGNNQGK